MFKLRKSRWWGAIALWLAASMAAPVQAGPIIDWFRNMHSPPKPPCANGTCAKPAACTVPGACPTATPNTYYPGAPAPAATVGPTAAPTMVPGPVTYGAPAPGTVVQPGYAQPGYAPPRYGQPAPGAATIPPPGTVFPNTVTPPPAYPSRTTNYPPVTTLVPGSVSAPAVAQAAYYAPVGAAPPAAIAVANCPNCARSAAPPTMVPQTGGPQMVRYAPYTAYRTNWVQVPVTVYRPITAIDPATGRPVTVVQPCTATAWQAQRVPVHGQPFLSRYQPLPVSSPPGVVVGAPMAMPAASVPMAAPAANCPTGFCPQPSAPVGTGVMPAAPPIAAPASPPTTLGPAATQPPSYLGSPARVTPPPSGAAPADQRPTLSPGEGGVPGAYNYAPQRDPYSNLPPYIPPPPAAPPRHLRRPRPRRPRRPCRARRRFRRSRKLGLSRT